MKDLNLPIEQLANALERFEEEVLWLNMMKDRNLTSHTYEHKNAMEIFQKAPAYLKAMKIGLDAMKSRN